MPTRPSTSGSKSRTARVAVSYRRRLTRKGYLRRRRSSTTSRPPGRPPPRVCSADTSGGRACSADISGGRACSADTSGGRAHKRGGSTRRRLGLGTDLAVEPEEVAGVVDARLVDGQLLAARRRAQLQVQAGREPARLAADALRDVPCEVQDRKSVV